MKKTQNLPPDSLLKCSTEVGKRGQTGDREILKRLVLSLCRGGQLTTGWPFVRRDLPEANMGVNSGQKGGQLTDRHGAWSEATGDGLGEGREGEQPGRGAESRGGGLKAA